MEDAVVEPGAVVTSSVVGPRAVVGAGARLHEVTVGDDARIGNGLRLDGDRVECGAEI